MSGPTLADLLAAALRDERLARGLSPALRSDLAVPHVFRRQIGRFLADFLDEHGTLPKEGDWQSWVESLGEKRRAGVREALHELWARDVSGWTRDRLLTTAPEALYQRAARTAVARLNRLEDPGEALPELAAEVERIGRLAGEAELERVEMTPLDTITPEEVDWLWPSRIPLGTLTFLEGDPGLGKSTLALDVAARLSTGRKMPDGTQPDVEGSAGTVLLTAEDSLKYTVRPRLDAAEADPARIVSVEGVRYRGEGERFPHLQDVAAVEEAVRAVGARMIVVDPLAAYLPPGTDSYRDASVRQALKELVALADRLGVAVVAIRHLTKDQDKKALYRGGGSIGLIGAARSGLLVAEHPDDDTGEVRVLASTKANLCRVPPSLAFLLHPVGHVVVLIWQDEVDYSADQILRPADPEERTAIEEAEGVIRRELSEGERPVQEVKAVARKLGISWEVMKKAKSRLEVDSRKEGFGDEGQWLWRLPDSEGPAPKGSHKASASPLGGETPRKPRDSGPKPKRDGDSPLGPKRDLLSPLGNPPDTQGKLTVLGPKRDSNRDPGPLRGAEGG